MNVLHIRSLPTTGASFCETNQPSSKGIRTPRSSSSSQLHTQVVNAEKPVPVTGVMRQPGTRTRLVQFVVRLSRKIGRFVGLSKVQSQKEYARAVSRFRQENLEADELKEIYLDLGRLSHHRNFSHRAEARLYMFIVGRFLKQNARETWLEFFNDEQLCRTAVLNQYADYLAVRNRADEGDEARIVKMISDLTKFVENNPDDCYAALLLALTFYEGQRDTESAIAVLEQLYLRAPDYSAGISVLAEMYRSTGLTRTAREYCDEAFEKNPKNIHAAQLAVYLGSRKVNPDKVSSTYFHQIDGLTWWRPLAILFTPYGVQDPDHVEVLSGSK